MNDRHSATITSHGVEELLARIRAEGVESGRAEAAAIVAAAEQQAQQIVRAAEAEAERLRAEATAEAERQQRAGEEALRVAARDALLDLKQQLAEKFSREVSSMVGEGMRDPELLARLILEVAARTGEEIDRGDDEPLEVILPRDVVGLEELRRRPEELSEGALSRFVAQSVGELLQQGVTLGFADDDAQGIRLHLVARNLTIDLTDRAVAELLLRHLQPRYRALLEGVVR